MSPAAVVISTGNAASAVARGTVMRTAGPTSKYGAPSKPDFRQFDSATMTTEVIASVSRGPSKVDHWAHCQAKEVTCQ